MSTGFGEFGLPNPLLVALGRVGYVEPTPIQSAVIPTVMLGGDVLGSSQTGSGKTGAFVIPLLARIMSGGGDALIMAPTRELAAQIYAFVKSLLHGLGNMSAVLLTGGSPMAPQLAALRRKLASRIVVGTPGRILDHMSRRSLSLSDVRLMVLDETDCMLDFGFAEQIEEVVSCLPTGRSTMMFSATMPHRIVSLSKKYMIDPVSINVGGMSSLSDNIKQEILHVDSHDLKYDKLLEELDRRDGSVIVFVGTKAGASVLAERLSVCGHSVGCIHGDLRQAKRDRVIRRFRDKLYRIMVATDVASRGLDIPHIEHVINYDMPRCLEDYVHRVGRTARAGCSGSAVIFLTSMEKRKWNEIGHHFGMVVAVANDEKNKGGCHRRAAGRFGRGANFSRRRRVGVRS